eukprot:gene15656-biopygen15754
MYPVVQCTSAQRRTASSLAARILKEPLQRPLGAPAAAAAAGHTPLLAASASGCRAATAATCEFALLDQT